MPATTPNIQSGYAAAPVPGVGGSTPVPDPTTLTTDQLRREIGAARESFGLEFANLKNLLDALAVSSDRNLTSAMDLCNVKFGSVEDKLALGERQRVEQKSDTEKAIQAALLAQQAAVSAQAESFEKSVNKSEVATNKQLDQMQATFRAENNNLGLNLDDLKGRVTVTESTRITQAQHDEVLRELADLRRSRDLAAGAATRTVLLLGAFFSALVVVLRFIPG